MSAICSSVEWLFGDIVNYFKFLDLKKNSKIGLSQLGKMYIVCAILHNALTSLNGNTTSQFFLFGSSFTGGLFCVIVIITVQVTFNVIKHLAKTQE